MSRSNKIILGLLEIGDIFVLNCKHRTDRKKKFKEHASKKKLRRYKWFTSTYIKSKPEKGKLITHVQAIKMAKRRKLNSVLILEDDALILTPQLLIPQTPKIWDILYLGGNVQKLFDDPETNRSTMWKRVACLTSHAYVMNCRMFDTFLKEAYKLRQTGESDSNNFSFDKWFCQTLHLDDTGDQPIHKVYMVTPEYVIQRDGFSDVKGKRVTYNQISTRELDQESERRSDQESDQESRKTFRGLDQESERRSDQESERRSDQESERRSDQESDQDQGSDQDQIANSKILRRNKIQSAPIAQREDGTICLKMPEIEPEDLPYVTLVTPTRNCRTMFHFTVTNFFKFDYPKHKLQWIIADDSDPDQKVRDLVPGDDNRIKYINCKLTGGEFLSTTKKLNLCLSYSEEKYGIVLHMFDNVYYPPHSVLSRVKILMQKVKGDLKRPAICGSTNFGVYDIAKEESYEADLSPSTGCDVLTIASLGYTKQFWKDRRWDEDRFKLESFHYTRRRVEQCVQIPYPFILFVLDHNETLIKKEERGEIIHSDSSSKGAVNFFNDWDIGTQKMINLLKQLLK
jgi:hypothetical protein